MTSIIKNIWTMCEVVGFSFRLFHLYSNIVFFCPAKAIKMFNIVTKIKRTSSTYNQVDGTLERKKTHPKPEHRSEKLANGQLTCELIDGIDETI